MTPNVISHGERIAAVEVRLQKLEETVVAMDRKLDDLLELRWKGAGAFWLAAALVGTGIVGMITQFLHYIGAK
jgi:hypothetical protein